MASAPNPSGRSRFAKLGMAINEEMTQACRDVLEMEVPPGLVYIKVKSHSVYSKIHPKQELCLIRAKTVGYKEFDISLLYTLIRNICTKISSPTNGWGVNTMPSEGETRIGDDIERIRFIRNNMLGHIGSASISEADFDDTWSIITDICQRLQRYTKKDYMSGLNNIQSQALEEEHVKYVIEKLEEDYKSNKYLMESVSSLQEHLLEKVSSVEEYVIEKVSFAEKHVVEKMSSAEEHVLERLSSVEKQVLELESKFDKKENRLLKDVLEYWREDDKTFVPTRASKVVEEKLQSLNFITVVGNSGSGKSAIIQHIALKYKERGWNVIPVDTVKKNIEGCFSGVLETQTLLVFNDPFGKESVDELYYHSWDDLKTNRDIFLKKNKLLISCRRCVFYDKRVKGNLLDESTAVEIDNRKNGLTVEEKRAIFYQYSRNLHLPEKVVTEIIKTDAYFPLLCRLFPNDTNKEKGVDFFKKPYKLIKMEIEIWKKIDPEKFCSLILIIAFKNNLNIDTIVKNDVSLKKLKNIVRMCALTKKTHISIIRSTLRELKGSYVKCVGNTFQFLHDFIMEITTLVFGDDCPRETIQYADSGFLRRRVKIEDDTEEEDRDPFTVYLPEEYIDDLVDRLINDMQTEHLVDVLLNPCIRERNVIKSFKKKIDEPEKLLVKIKCEKERSEIQKSFERVFFTRLDFLYLQDEICPLIGLILFCHNEISSFFLKLIPETKLSEYPFFSALCANGDLNQINYFSEEYKKTGILKKWGKFLPIHIASIFHNFQIIEELVRLGADVNGYTTPYIGNALQFAALNQEKHLKEAGKETDTSEGEMRDTTITYLLKNGAKINLCNKKGASPLYLACQNGHDSTVQLLLNKNADINLYNKNGASPLYIACQNGHEGAVQLLLENGAKINLCDNDGFSPLYLACQNGHYNTVNLLLNKGANINLCNKNGDSALCLPCQNGHDRIVQLLLNNGADINFLDNDGFSPLYIACQNGHDSTVQLLLNNGANINLCDNDGFSPLYIACQKKYESTVKLLLKKGAYINLYNKNRCSPLYIACQNGQNSTVQLLLYNGAKVNLCEKNGASPLYIACQNGHNSTVQLLLNNGANINLCDEFGVSPLFNACQYGYNSIVKIILSNGADINSCNTDGINPLCIACQNGHDTTVQLLLDNGADINLCQNDPFSPLYIACYDGRDSTVQLLLNNGADINLCDKSGLRPLSIACQNGHDSTVQLLLNNGAEVNLCDNEGDSPLHIACYYGHQNCVKILVKYGANINLCNKTGDSPMSIAMENKLLISNEYGTTV